MPDNCPVGVENKTRINNLQKEVNEIKEAIQDIRDRLLGRPSWVILFLFTIMSSSIVGLIMAVITGIGRR